MKVMVSGKEMETHPSLPLKERESIEAIILSGGVTEEEYQYYIKHLLDSLDRADQIILKQSSTLRLLFRLFYKWKPIVGQYTK